MPRVLAIDDERNFLDTVVSLLQYRNYTVDTLGDPMQVLSKMATVDYDCVLLDVKMPGKDGTQVLEEIVHTYPEIPVIMLSGQSTLSIAVNSIKKGAYDFIEKGADTDRLLITVNNAVEKKKWYKQRSVLLKELQEQYQMIGTSAAMQDVFRQIETIAPTDAKVLITGETGTGKELVARAIHLRSQRASQPYIKVNCAAIPDTLIESSFFGHKRGAFSGAVNDQIGRFEQAAGGTIFLDEIGELNLQAQAKLLRVLDDGQIEKIGAASPIEINTRVIAATNRNLPQMVEEGKFRLDLFHRLSVFKISLPPLTQRLDDIPLLAAYFMQKYSEKYNKSFTGFSKPALRSLTQQEWKGNVRALKNTIEKAVVFATGPLIKVEHILPALSSDTCQQENMPHGMLLQDFLDLKEKEFIEKSLLLVNGKKQAAADLIGVDRATLWRKMQKYNLEPPKSL